ncbi:MAG: hypothetical protein ACLQNE_36065 [Thermoguttaceae bacterium]
MAPVRYLERRVAPIYNTTRRQGFTVNDALPGTPIDWPGIMMECQRASVMWFGTQVIGFALPRRYNGAMRIHELVWPQDRIDHIDRYGVAPEEVEETCFGHALVQRAKSEGENPVYYVLGQTNAGRYLFCVVIQFPDGKGYPITARPMTDKEKRRYHQWKNR